MPKPSQKVELNTFVKGLISEASPLNFPPNASVDELNFELNRDGTRRRRFGMDEEVDAANLWFNGFDTDTTKQSGHGTFIWTSVEGKVDREFVVRYVGNILIFCNLNARSISGGGYLNYLIIPQFPQTATLSFTSIDGKLVVAGGIDSIAQVSYNPDNNTFSYETYRIKVRDVWGIETPGPYETDDMFRGSEGQTPITQIYNLQNQSWGVPRKNFVITILDPFGVTAKLQDPLQYFLQWKGVYPSNSETVYGGLNFQSASANDLPSERMYPTLWDEVRGSVVKSAKGYFIIDLLRRGNSRVEAAMANKARFDSEGFGSIVRTLTSAPADYTTGGARIVREFAGRVFYAGFDGTVVEGDSRSPNLENMIVFSQLVKSPSDIAKCYQEGDPTSREGNDIVDTDGGFVKISGADKIVGLYPLGSSLMVLATNGVWQLSGGSDYGFTATNYKVSQISKVGVIAPRSIVEEVGKIFFWARDGIYVVGANEMQDMAVQSLTQTTIQKYFESLETRTRESARGVYDVYNKRVRWIMDLGEPFSASGFLELIYDMSINAFYKFEISSANGRYYIDDLFMGPPYEIEEFDDPVIVGSEQVLVVSEPVVRTITEKQNAARTVRYSLISNIAGGIYGTFGWYRDVGFVDWRRNTGGVDARAYLLTGAQIAGDSSIYKQVPYLTFHMKETETGLSFDGTPINPSSCRVRSQWDFADSPYSNRWGVSFEVYRPRTIRIRNDDGSTGFDVITSKSKLRGRGKSFSMFMETSPGYDCYILGWNLAINGNPVT